jgi:hypothetical protein
LADAPLAWYSDNLYTCTARVGHTQAEIPQTRNLLGVLWPLDQEPLPEPRLRAAANKVTADKAKKQAPYLAARVFCTGLNEPLR